jgi:DOPA 4,5-dioxygenase
MTQPFADRPFADQPFADPGAIRGWHAHIYYDGASRAAAERLREAIGAGFDVQLGRWHDEPVGPHPVSMYQIAFAAAEFPRLVPWLALNRGPLTVLVHPQAEDAYQDHTAHAVWLGPPLKLRLEVLRRGPRGPAAGATGGPSATARSG